MVHNTGLQGFVEKLWIVSGVIFDVESESGIRISLSCQDFEIFEVMCSKNGVFRYFWAYVQGARNFFSFVLKCHHSALPFPFKMSYKQSRAIFFTKIRPYQVLPFIRTTLRIFTLTLWCIPFCIRNFILKICACGFWWSVNKNLQSENWHFHF